ncbi:hypothetical protein HQ585_17120 [candidate division KSB1 bacterium]|nr:hypothetical protein [candidate division KSB1 bacterium]
MKSYLYLSLIPEALIASMLPPEEFGTYLAIGTKKRTRGEAIFFEIDTDFKSDFFNLSSFKEKCVPHENGEPKKTFYLSIYRVLENVPLNALKNLYLTTDNGRVLELKEGTFKPETDGDLHLYQELAPVTPFIASELNPVDFCQFITDKKNSISVPTLAFVELQLHELAKNPDSPCIRDLPYSNIDHLKDNLKELKEKPDKITKTVIRSVHNDILFRMVKNGFFIGDHQTLKYYPFPSVDDLESKYYAWWRSAQTICFRH